MPTCRHGKRTGLNASVLRAFGSVMASQFDPPSAEDQISTDMTAAWEASANLRTPRRPGRADWAALMRKRAYGGSPQHSESDADGIARVGLRFLSVLARSTLSSVVAGCRLQQPRRSISHKVPPPDSLWASEPDARAWMGIGVVRLVHQEAGASIHSGTRMPPL